MKWDEIDVRIIGTTGLCMNCTQKADPLCDHAAFPEFKKLSKKRNKTEDDYWDLAKLEWWLSLYINENGKIYLPERCLVAALKDTAKRQKLGKKFNASVMVQDAILEFPDADKSLLELWDSKKYYIRTCQKVGTAKVMRTTPRFSEWQALLKIKYMSSEVDKESIMQVLRDMGEINGMFEFRPHFGRFRIE